MPIQKVFVRGLSTFIVLLTSLSLYAQDYYRTTNDLNLRSGAGKKYPVIIILEKGDTVNVLEETSEYWVKVQVQGEVGFTSKEYLEKIEVAKNERKVEDEVDGKTESDTEALSILISFLAILVIVIILKKKGETFRYKSVALILSFLLGILGFQKFYLGERNKGILSILFCWTYIPMLIGGVDFIRLLLMKEAKFNSLYNFGKSPEVNLRTKRMPQRPKPKAKTLIKPETHSYQVKRNHVDDSIIDVNPENLNLRIGEDTKSERLYKEPPYWRHTYIYSFDEIQSVTKTQKEYYLYFKGKVLEGKYVDLKGNTNYAFILYFDFINEYKKHKDIKRLDQLFNLLSEISPKTTSYSSSYIEEELRRIGEEYSIENLTKLKGRIRPEKNKTPKKVKEPEKQNIPLKYTYTPYDPDEHKLGTKYKRKLNLSKREVALLNKFHNPSNVFISIKGCCIAVIRVYLAVFKDLETRLKKKKTTIDLKLENVFDEVCKIEKIKFSRYNVKYERAWAVREFNDTFYGVFFKMIENLVREEYGNKRKLSFKKYHPYSNSEEFINEAIGDEIELLIIEKMKDLITPDLETLVALNKQNVNRWKIQLESLKNDFKKGADEDFLAGIDRLEETNKENPNIENIFFEASKFIAKYNKVVALNCYAKYVYYDLKSKKVKDKKLTKTAQKLLFKTEEQVAVFEAIVANLKQTRDLKTALDEIPKIYILKRKKIKLDRSEIQNIEKKHEGTVELLNEYLVEEKEEKNAVIEGNMEEVIAIETPVSSDSDSIFISDINMEQVQEELVKMMVSNSYELEQKLVEEYALKNGMFKNQLIDSINEACEAYLEGEALIEEEDENYIIEESYYIEIAK